MKLLITGDLVVNNSYNIDCISNDIVDLFANSDFNIVNLEAPITFKNEKIIKTGPHIKANKKSTLEVLKTLNINLVTLANNHLKDYGENGVAETLLFCYDNNIATVGAGINLENAKKTFYLKNKEKIIAIINFAENEWASASKSSAGSHPMDIIENVHEMKNAKRNSDYVICIIHGGHEYYNLPSPRMQKQYRFYAENGADLIVGHHTHCIGGYEIYQGVPIYYSLGNFLFTKNATNPDWYIGLILEIEWKEDQLKTTLRPVCQEKETFKLYLPKGKEQEEIFNRVQSYSEIIQDESLLEQSWEQYISLKTGEYLNYWSPSSFVKNRFLRGVLNKLGIDFKNKKGLSLFLNLMRCEAHSDLSKEIINKYLNK